MLMALISLSMISACANSENSSVAGGIVDNSTNTGENGLTLSKAL